MTRSFFVAMLTLLLLGSAAVGVRQIGAGRSLETHEVFVAQTSREMLASGDLVVPTFGGELRLKKPPLMYWAVAGVAMVTGERDVPPWVARTPSLLSSLLMVFVTAVLGRVLFDRQTGLVAGAMLAFSWGVFNYAGNARPEMMYAACTGVMSLGFGAAWHRRDEEHRHWKKLGPVRLGWAELGWLGLGLALLAKGPQLPLMVLGGLSAWALFHGGFRAWASTFRPITGLAVLVLLISPWLIAVLLRVDDAIGIWRHELIGLRFEDASEQAEAGGIASGVWAWLVEFVTPEYLLFCVWMLLPWGGLVFMGLCGPWVKRPEMHAGRPLFAALVVTLIGLSVPTHWRDYYLLPGLPILSVLIASGVTDFLRKAEAGKGHRTIGLAMVGLISALGLAFPAIIHRLSGSSPFPVVWGAVVLGLAGLLYWLVHSRARAGLLAGPLGSVLVLSLTLWGGALFLVSANTVLWSTRHERIDLVARAAAEASVEQSGLETIRLPVYAIGFDPDDLIYRVNRPVTVLGRDLAPGSLIIRSPMILVAPPGVIDRGRVEGLVAESLLIVEIEEGEFVEVALVPRSDLPPLDEARDNSADPGP